MSGTNSLTSANVVLMLSVAGLYDSPQQIQGFDVDEATDIDPITVAETKMGVDGVFSAGRIYAEVPQNIMLQADSASVDFFDNWRDAQESSGDIYWGSGTLVLPSVSKIYTLSQGVLKTYAPIPNVRKILQPRKFMITWGRVTGAPT